MKGLLLSHYYSNEKSIIIYFLIGIIVCSFFAFINPLMSSFVIMILLITPATDNLKNEKDSRWMNYISTLPITRSTYIISHFCFYILLGMLGLLISTIITVLTTGSLFITLASLLVGSGVILQYTMVFPFTFKFGSEKSNTIFLITSFLIIILHFIFYYGLLTFGNGSPEDILENITTNLMYSLFYAFLGFVILVISIFMSIKIYNYKEL